ncbi:MAG: MoxR family ATPase [Algisphaera sp.]
MNDDNDPQLLADAAQAFGQLREQIGRVIVGQTDIVDALLAAVLAEGHTLLIGVPGLAKTLLVKTLSDALGWDFQRIQFTPDLMPADIIGMELLDEDDHGKRTMRFVPGPIFAQLVLADEINRTPPKTQAALLEAMQERQVTSMGKRHDLPKPFIVVATQNPIEQEGTYPLPEAQLDRFMLSLHLDYPGVEEEEQIVAQTTVPHDQNVESVLSQAQIEAFQALTQRIPASQHVVSYAVALARATRPGSATAAQVATQYLAWGAGPRAGQHLIRTAKAFALMDGEPAATTDHVRRAAPHVLRHRILTNFAAAGDNISAGDVVQRVLDEVKLHTPLR